jgi:mannose-6-phosphate isomerase-like protein (cupin superfamily)
MNIPTHLTAAGMAAQPLPPGRLSQLAFDTGEVELRFYAPAGTDNQVPHDRDELYFVVHGSGTFVRESERAQFTPGDVLFAAAGERHRFTDFSPDLTLWVLFYGQKRR